MKALSHFLLGTAILAASTNVMAEEEKKDFFDIKFGGWSFTDSDQDLNDNHKGIGLDYYRSFSKNDRHYLGASVFYMRDAYDENSYQIAAVYKYSIPVNNFIDSVDLNFGFGLNNRTYQEDTFTLDPNGHKIYDTDRDTRLVSIPYVTVNFTQNLQMDFTYTPEDWANSLTEHNEVFFFRFGYRYH